MLKKIKIHIERITQWLSQLMNNNIIGDNGENLAALRLSKYGHFQVYVLGGKTPYYDLVGDVCKKGKRYQFLVQVKSTSSPSYNKSHTGIKTPVSKRKLRKLIETSLPTYVVGVDLNSEEVYIAPAFDVHIKYSSYLPMTYALKNDIQADKIILDMLQDDIIDYWDNISIIQHKTAYKSRLK